MTLFAFLSVLSEMGPSIKGKTLILSGLNSFLSE